MCGICGFAGPSAGAECLDKMTNAIFHRGPDDGGTWTDPATGVGLGSRRLAIIDISPQGHQPMRSASGRYVLAFNGEIYNFRQLREELLDRGHTFRGRSDTEVLLESVAEWGVRGALERANGMFAVALYDSDERALYLARDRVGEKPLYHATFGTTFIFGSELKALRAHPDFRAEIDRRSLTMYLRYQYVPTPYTIYAGVQKLAAGCVLKVDLRGDAPIVGTAEPFWSARDVVRRAEEQRFDGSLDDATDRLARVLRDATEIRMISDVPLGAFLSGGIDSSTIVALMQDVARTPVRTFSIGFHEEGYNEAPYARRVAEHLGCDHTEMYVTPDEARDVIPLLPDVYDEPFADSSQIPTWLVSRLAREHVTVALTGDGGDELFGGYGRYPLVRDNWSRVARIPRVVRRAGGGVARLAMRSGAFSVADMVSRVAGRRSRSMGGALLNAAAHVGEFGRAEDMYRYAMSLWADPADVVIGGEESWDVHTDPSAWPEEQTPVERMMFIDLLSYLPDAILVKVDRAAMNVSLETRIPMLDPNVIDFAWTLPMSMRLEGTEGKVVLRRLLGRYLPADLIDRSKMGFGVPIGSWLRGPLRDWGEALLDGSRLEREGYFHAAPIRRAWRQHLEGRADWKYQLWTVLMFQAWLERESLA